MIQTEDALRSLYPAPGERSVKKQLNRLDRHCRRFIELSPFCVLATCDDGGRVDASPRGGAAGFVQVADDHTLWIPDSIGNNRLDSLTNIIKNPGVGIIFLIPGVDETLRINGVATLYDEAERIEAFTKASGVDEARPPRLILQVDVQEAFLHCAKALMRSKLWHDDSRIERQILPTMGQMLKEQIGSEGPIESQEEMVARYSKDL